MQEAETVIEKESLATPNNNNEGKRGGEEAAENPRNLEMEPKGMTG
jgi:hypothetical protein